MKKLRYILLLPILCLLFGWGVSSCGDNTDFSKAHVLTDSELDELQRQQHILDSLRQIINADTILYYTIDAYPSTVWGNAGEVHLDYKAMGEVFGLSEQQVLEALCLAPGCVDFVNVAIQGTTHADQATNSTNRTNGYWGHWYQYNGDVVAQSYSEPNSRFYVEWQGEYAEEEGECINDFFGIGLFPERGEAGDKYQAIECFIYNDARVAIVIDINIKERGAITAGVINTQKINVDYEANNTYEPLDVEFDLNQTLSDLGVASLVDLQWLAVKADGSYEQEYNCEPMPGFWFGLDGYKGAWGDNASFGVCLPNEEGLNTFTIMAMPNNMPSGSLITLEFGVMAGDKIEMFELTVNVTDAKAIEGDVAYSADLYVSDRPRSNYNTVDIPFDRTAVISALGINSLNDARVIGIDKDGEYTRAYTGGSNEFWYNEEGEIDAYANGAFFIGYGEDDGSESAATFHIGQMPDKLEIGYSVVTKIGFMNEEIGKIAMFTIHFNVVAADAISPSLVATQNPVMDFDLNYGPYNQLPCEIDYEAAASSLGYSSLDDATWLALKKDGSYADEYDDANSLFWFDYEGFRGAWGSDARLMVSYVPGSNVISVGLMDLDWSTIEEPQLFANYVAWNPDNNKAVMFKITVNIGETDYNSIIAGAELVWNKKLSCEAPINNDYEGYLFDIDHNEIMTALGVSSMDDVLNFAVLPDGSRYFQGMDPAYWFGADNYQAPWGQDARYCLAYYGYDPDFPEDIDLLYVMLMPAGDEPTCLVGDVYHGGYGFYANDKVVTYAVDITVVENTPVTRSMHVNSHSASFAKNTLKLRRR